MRVLFVDDEVRVLEAIERVLFELDTNWETCFVNSGERALAELAKQPFDVIVSDMRMPGMDGVALLTKACELYPRTVRIVLSGQTDEEAALKMVRVAHQFLAKPCGSETLFRVISRTSELNALLGDKRLQAIVGQVGALGSPPRLYSELCALLEREDTNAAALSKVIKQDPAMSSKLLQVANSAFFNSSASVSDVDTAIMRLGFRTLRNLMLGIGAFESAKGSVDASFSVDELQQQSLAVARLASSLVSQPEDASAAFMAGLMCNIGQLVLATTAPERLYVARAEAERSSVAPHVAERATWGVTHAELGAFLLGLWGIPFQIVEAVANHHAPERNAHDRFALPQVVWLASCIVEGEEPDPALLQRFHAVETYAKHRAAYQGAER
jgi:HD-like signal output (HDOD) protein/ActR/RegA family two-component response regulator